MENKRSNESDNPFYQDWGYSDNNIQKIHHN
jgi:hypothetical protein